MSLQNHLLSDDQMCRFIAHGYLILKTDFPAEFHDHLNARLDEVMTKEGNWGNNILPRLSEVNDVFQSPVIQGALTSVVGPGYGMHPHRHCHFPRTQSAGLAQRQLLGLPENPQPSQLVGDDLLLSSRGGRGDGAIGHLSWHAILCETGWRRDRAARLYGGRTGALLP